MKTELNTNIKDIASRDEISVGIGETTQISRMNQLTTTCTDSTSEGNKNNQETNEANMIDLGKIAKLLWKKRSTFIITLFIVAICSAILIFPEPRYYEAEVSMAPETSGSEMDLGGITSIASSFGLNLGGDQADAIYPLLYPELFKSNEFIVSLFGIQITTGDQKLKCDYYTYMLKHQKKNKLTWPVKLFFKNIKNIIFPQPKITGNGSYEEGNIDPFRLSYYDYMLVEGIKSNINCSVDKKTNVITIKVIDQDPLVCATMADSLRCRLQDFITEYRTSKVRTDYEYYSRLLEKADSSYRKSVDAYAKYCDTHQNMVLQSYISERLHLENDMQLKYQTVLSISTQAEAAKAKVQARTPVFTTLKSTTVPIRPAGPKRMIFIIGMCFITSILLCFWIARKEIFMIK